MVLTVPEGVPAAEITPPWERDQHRRRLVRGFRHQLAFETPGDG
ncbi:MAG TPA: hypothetical protein VFV66_25020 [Nonomuraea sp.]|nr:hypothetical protein [Nonomuraea sp.]